MSVYFGETDRVARALIVDERKVWHQEGARTAELRRIPGMICDDESLYLYWLAKHYYTGAGAIIDLGPLAGSSSLALASGLSENANVPESEKRIYSFDLWSYLGGYSQFFPTVKGVDGVDVLPTFLANLGEKAKYVTPTKGDLRSQYWHNIPVEIIFVDIAKSVDTWVHLAKQFFTQAIPGRTILVNQDMVSVDCPWIPLYMQLWRDHFDYVDSPYGGSISYRFKSHIQVPDIDQSFYESIDTDAACELFDRTQSELNGWAALYMPLCKATFLLLRGRSELARKAIEQVRADSGYRYEYFSPAFDYFKNKFGVRGPEVAWLNDLSI